MGNDYIPSTDSGLADWLLNFSTLITATPTAYGLTSGNAVTIAAQNTAYQAAYALAVDPSTRTAPTVAAKDVARANALAVVRPFAIQINNNPAVTDGQRGDLGLTIRKTVPTPIPAPTSAPAISLVAAIHGQVTLAYKDPAAPTGKAKPFGAIGMQIASVIGTTPAVDPSQARIGDTYTKSPFRMTFDGGDAGKICSVYGRYVTRGGPQGIAQYGPWSALLNFNIL